MIRSGIISYYQCLMDEGEVSVRLLKNNLAEGRITWDEYYKILDMYNYHCNCTNVIKINKDKDFVDTKTNKLSRKKDSFDYMNPITNPNNR